MARVTIDPTTGALVIGGGKAFPIVLSNPPPLGKRAPTGKAGLAEVAAGGVNMIRTGVGTWDAELLPGQIQQERAWLDAAAQRELHTWTYLGQLPNLPATAGNPPSVNEQLLVRVVNALKGHQALAAWKGLDEPSNEPHPGRYTRPPGLTRAYKRIKALDPNHPIVITQAPRNTAAELAPYRPAFDVTGADIYPISYPPGIHSDLPNRDISVVGEVTRKMVQAAGGKPVWMTLQIAWSGMAASKDHPERVPRFPSLREERFMAYQAIVAGARGLVFFGGHLTQVLRPVDARAGWNWTFWQQVLRPLVGELTSTAVHPALVAPDAKAVVNASSQDVELRTRDDGSFLYVIAVRRGGATSRVAFAGLPRRRDGTPIRGRGRAPRVPAGAVASADQAEPGVPVRRRHGRRLPRLVRPVRRAGVPVSAVAARAS
jgi:hypothetical protein